MECTFQKYNANKYIRKSKYFLAMGPGAGLRLGLAGVSARPEEGRAGGTGSAGGTGWAGRTGWGGRPSWAGQRREDGQGREAGLADARRRRVGSARP